MELVIRVTVIYVFILVGLRVLGKREFGQLSPFELVTLLIIPEIVSNALTNEDTSITGGLIGVSTLLGLVYLTSLSTHLSKGFQKVFTGTHTVLVHRGKFIEENLNKERVGPDEIFDEMHKAGLERLEQVKWAILKPDGKISIVPESENAEQAKEEEPAT